MPDNFTDLYALPAEVTAAIKNYVMRGFPVRLDGPAQVALFAYDNKAFIAENFSAAAADVKISTLGNSTKLKNIVTGEMIEGKLPPPHGWNWRTASRSARICRPTAMPCLRWKLIAAMHARRPNETRRTLVTPRNCRRHPQFYDRKN
jgi:hypothetical protein